MKIITALLLLVASPAVADDRASYMVPNPSAIYCSNPLFGGFGTCAQALPINGEGTKVKGITQETRATPVSTPPDPKCEHGEGPKTEGGWPKGDGGWKEGKGDGGWTKSADNGPHNMRRN